MAKLYVENSPHIYAIPKRLQVFYDFALALKSLSKCSDKKVAALIVDAALTQVYSIGLNGGPKGGRDCLCGLGDKYTCIHAEVNAIAKCNTPDRGKVMICTLSPCVTCASLIVNSGFSKVYYAEEYRDIAGLQILETAGISTALITHDSIYEKDIIYYG